jgi:hypothetical protein
VEFIEESADPSAPVVDAPWPGPGPQTPLEVAMAPRGEAAPAGREVIVLGLPSLEDRLEARQAQEPHQDVVPTLPVPSGRDVAERVAGPGGDETFFLVAIGPPLELLSRAPGPVAELLGELPPGYEVAESRRFPGLDGLPVDVYRFERTAGPPG